MSNSLDSEIVGPDLGPNCLPWLSAGDTGRQRVKGSTCISKMVSYTFKLPFISKLSDHLGSRTHPCYVQTPVIMKSVIKKFSCTILNTITIGHPPDTPKFSKFDQ